MFYNDAGGVMNIKEKLHILADSAKYDASCSSSGSNRSGNGLGNANVSGICHSFSSDGRCISLLKILMTNACIFDCKYCPNRRSNNIKRAIFTPTEICEITINFYKRNRFTETFNKKPTISRGFLNIRYIFISGFCRRRPSNAYRGSSRHRFYQYLCRGIDRNQ